MGSEHPGVNDAYLPVDRSAPINQSIHRVTYTCVVYSMCRSGVQLLWDGFGFGLLILWEWSYEDVRSSLRMARGCTDVYVRTRPQLEGCM